MQNRRFFSLCTLFAFSCRIDRYVSATLLFNSHRTWSARLIRFSSRAHHFPFWYFPFHPSQETDCSGRRRSLVPPRSRSIAALAARRAACVRGANVEQNGIHRNSPINICQCNHQSDYNSSVRHTRRRCTRVTYDVVVRFLD